ncbi:conserved exported hypothetical protein [Frankia sp. AiPs1]|uniref:hypothetical protein n=1 Tax=Frankia sp. AiPa1 TaxID=573492 RepID=UPI00202AF9A9|nr:hypothetical protein [Frankia sp. AiPa1]MCL9759883.1 hypothetical protein [Frankia sp. AiPa1]
MRIKAAFGTVAAALVVLVGTLLVPAGTAQAATTIPCRATATVAHPGLNQIEPVYVETAPSASVTGVAHYRTTNTRKSGTTDVRGHRYLKWNISHATPGFQVIVTVTVTSGARQGTCSTSFTPIW